MFLENILLFKKLTGLIWNSILNVYEIRVKLKYNCEEFFDFFLSKYTHMMNIVREE